MARAAELKPGGGSFNLTAGVTEQMAFGRAEVLAHINDSMSAFGFAQVQDNFDHPLRPEFSAGAGLQIVW